MTKDEALKLALEALELLAKYENPQTKIQVRKPREGGSIVTMYPHKVAADAAALLREWLTQKGHREQMAKLGWQSFECPACGSEGARAFPKLESEPEPVAWMYEWNGTTHFTVTDQRFIEKAHPHFNKSTPLYTAPQQAALPLSAEQIEQLCHDTDHQVADHPQTWRWTEAFARAIEAAHGIKGDA